MPLNFEISFFEQKTNKSFVRSSALDFKKRLNKKSKETLFIFDYLKNILLVFLFFFDLTSF